MTDTSALLTIAIPTYQRNQLLRINFPLLLKQAESFGYSDQLRIVIIDNSSPVPVSNSLENLPQWVKIYRNHHNIGGNSKILRCFESCLTPWLWIIGDDDRIEDQAIADAFRHIDEHPGAMAIVSAVRDQVTRTESFTTVGIEDLLEHLDSFANLLFAPSTLYHVAALRPRFDLGHHFAYSCAPHLVLLITAVAEQQGQVSFVTESNIAFERPEVEIRGSIIPIAHGLPTLLELPGLSKTAKRHLRRHLRHFPSLGSLIHQTLLRQRFGRCGVGEGIHDYLSACRRMAWSDAPLRRLLSLGALPALWCPQLSYPVVAWVFSRLTGQASGQHKLPLERI